MTTQSTNIKTLIYTLCSIIIILLLAIIVILEINQKEDQDLLMTIGVPNVYRNYMNDNNVQLLKKIATLLNKDIAFEYGDHVNLVNQLHDRNLDLIFIVGNNTNIELSELKPYFKSSLAILEKNDKISKNNIIGFLENDNTALQYLTNFQYNDNINLQSIPDIKNALHKLSYDEIDQFICEENILKDITMNNNKFIITKIHNAPQITFTLVTLPDSEYINSIGRTIDYIKINNH